MGTQKMKDYYKVTTFPKCREASVAKGDKYRITVLTEGLLRLEYSESGNFDISGSDTMKCRYTFRRRLKFV